jgi:very-short-patch-repair endonuclease
MIIIDGGLPAPEPQIRVYDSTGRPMYRLDLGYREQKVGLEYDGQSHLTTSRLNADRSRMNWLSARGWTMRYFTAPDVYQSPIVVVATVRAALGL